MTRKLRLKRLDLLHQDIPAKANRILNLILLTIVIIVIRIWYLTVIQYDQKVVESQKPQKKVVVEPAIRATIRDRFNIPLAINKMQYQASVLYSQLQDIPSVRWEKDASGLRVKKFKRKEYIRQLSELLAQELGLDADRIEDQIYSKASYYSQVPYVIKDELSEREYYRLKALEREWPGIYLRKLPKRYYPRGRVAADVIGYMGAINRKEYENILHEMKMLDQLIRQSEEETVELPKGIESIAHAKKRLKDLEEKTYTIHDYIGKTGIEGMYEKQLRGFYGKKNYYSDSKGHFLRELPGSRPALSGYRILLTISAELQEYAEQLLAQNEEIRIVRLSHIGAIKKTILAMKHPWIKGGSIVVMDHQSGEILALASYPRFDPNDFISSGNPDINKEKSTRINKWFENEAYLANVWNQQQAWDRERFDNRKNVFYDEESWLSWNVYLDLILPTDSVLRNAMTHLSKIGPALEVQKSVEELMLLLDNKNIYQLFNVLYPEPHIPHKALSNADKREIESIIQDNQEVVRKNKKVLDKYMEVIPHNYDKALLVDLCRVAIDHRRFSQALSNEVKHFSLNLYKENMSHLVRLLAWMKTTSIDLYHDIDFKAWRKREEKEFLKQVRLEEKKNKSYPKPYLDYFDQKEKQFFNEFWNAYKWDLFLVFLTGSKTLQNPDENLIPYIEYFDTWHKEIRDGAHQEVDWKKAYVSLQKSIKTLSPPLIIEYLKSIRSYQELDRPLLGKYRSLRQSQHPLEKHLASAFYPKYGYGYGRSYAYRQAAIQGSIFKLITAYEALAQNFKKLNRKDLTFTELNPLIMTDQVFTQGQTNFVGYTKEGKPIPQLYKGGRIPRSLAHQNNGEVDLIKALEVSSNPYFSLLAGEFLEEPDNLTDAARLFSFGERTGINLPGEIAGNVPNDVSRNRTGLYSLAIGQHHLVVTPLQTAVMLSAIANGGKILKPKIVNLMAGRQPSRDEDLIGYDATFPHKDSLAAVGLDFPLFTAATIKHDRNLIERTPTEVRREIFMPSIIREMLLKGLQGAARRTHQESLMSLTRLYYRYPEAIRDFTSLKNQVIGKTSTSESVEVIDLDLNEGTNIYTHVWFGSVAFDPKSVDKKHTAFIFKDEFGEAEVVVVVYLRYGGYGKEAAPLAAQIVKKWRELKEKYNQ